MPNAFLRAEAVALWRRLNHLATDAEMLVAKECLDRSRGHGGGPSTRLRQLAADLRVLADEQREIALRAS